ncbi:hypothetical protein [Delftia tsuruhatensis]|uniref:hypothetical protein n=1 Tax=Delftia tsuruhatensis TaxID=180282 RepID=UPI001F24A534|nr:hypothetical protein [Delftia tsuruhatensis]
MAAVDGEVSVSSVLHEYPVFPELMRMGSSSGLTAMHWSVFENHVDALFDELKSYF